MKRLRVAIEISAGLQQGAGIGRYVANLVSALREIPDGPELFPYATREAVAKDAPPSLTAQPCRVLPLGHRGWRLLSLASYTARVAPRGLLPACDVVHATELVLPRLERLPAVVTVHDLAFLRIPEAYTLINRSGLRWLAPRVVREARFVVAVSHATGRDLASLLGVQPERIRVVPEGCELERYRPCPGEDPGPVLERLGIELPYLLFVGTWEPRKNLVALLEAFDALKREGLPHRLVLAGSRGWRYRGIEERLQSLAFRDHVVCPGRVAEPDLPTLYRAAEAFVYPSHYEGFGLPVLEAMACGTPVVSSNTSSLPELVEDAGLLVAPTDVHALKDAIRAAVRPSDLRARLMRAGPARAARFTWRAAAERTAQVYAEAARTTVVEHR
jgi:glycosyltransferase involved in cell wall biosynthesis